MLFNFGKEYKKRLLESGHSLVALIQADTDKMEVTIDTDIGGFQILVYKYFWSIILEAEEWLQMTWSADGRGRKMRILH